MQFRLHFLTDLVALITGMTLKAHLDALEARNWHFKVWYKNRKPKNLVSGCFEAWEGYSGLL